MADLTRKKGLLDYVNQGASDEDLLAAGYTEQEIRDALPTPTSPRIPDFQVKEGDTIAPYTPTRRDNVRGNVEAGLESLGLPKGASQHISDGLVGTGESSSLSDFTPFGALFGFQEGSQQAKRGWDTGNKKDMALGAVNTVLSGAEAFPLTKGIIKGLGKVADVVVNAHDPTTIRMFFGPSSPKADLSQLDRAQQMVDKGSYSKEEIWNSTGWWNSPNGWRFEISDHNMQIHPEALAHVSGKFGAIGKTSDVAQHPEFFEALGTKSPSSLTQITRPTGNSNSGSFNPNTLRIEATAKTDKELRSILLHELQHFEQKTSKVTSGSNPQYTTDKIEKTLTQVPREGLEYLAVKKQALSELDNVSPQDVQAQTDWLNYIDQQAEKTLGTDFKESLDKFFDMTGGFTGGVVHNPKTGLVSRDIGEYSQGIGDAGYTTYIRDKGEAEARLTALRADLTDSQRSLIHPESQMDVPKELQTDYHKFNRVLNNLVSDGDNYKNSPRKFAEGGAVLDPVSKNEVPAGATPNEVRDNIDAKVSEGEYIIPANVVRYLGLDKIEKMINQAKKGLDELDAAGRIGGSSPDDLPFNPDELQAVDESQQAAPVKMAEGGMVQGLNPALDPNSNERDPKTGLPLWLVNLQGQTPAPAPAAPTPAPTAPAAPATFAPARTGSDPEQRAIINELTGMAQSVDKWTPHEFNNYAKSRNSVEQRLGQGLASMLPLGGLAAKMRQGYLEKAVPTQMTKMLETGKDLQGNPLSTEQLTQLKDNYKNLSDNPLGGGVGLSAVAQKAVKNSGLIKKRDPSAPKREGLISRIIDKVTGKPKETTKSTPTKSTTKSDSKSEAHKSTTKSSTTKSKSAPSKTASSNKSTTKSTSSRAGSHGGGR